MEDFGTLYIVQNTPTIAENALKNYFWHDKEISETIGKSCNHAREYHYCDVDLLRASVNAEIFNVLRSKENFQKFINGQRKKFGITGLQVRQRISCKNVGNRRIFGKCLQFF